MRLTSARGPVRQVADIMKPILEEWSGTKLEYIVRTLHPALASWHGPRNAVRQYRPPCLP
jgi:hypothetical protein